MLCQRHQNWFDATKRSPYPRPTVRRAVSTGQRKAVYYRDRAEIDAFTVEMEVRSILLVAGRWIYVQRKSEESTATERTIYVSFSSRVHQSTTDGEENGKTSESIPLRWLCATRLGVESFDEREKKGKRTLYGNVAYKVKKKRIHASASITFFFSSQDARKSSLENISFGNAFLNCTLAGRGFLGRDMKKDDIFKHQFTVL